MKNILLSISLILGLTIGAQAKEEKTLQASDVKTSPGIDVKAPQAYMIDLQTGTILLEKNAEEKMAPSSMSKIVTAHLIFERLKSGDVKLDDMLHVSEAAWRTEGSKMFVNVNTQVPLEELLKGIIVQSGNDACVVVAEGLAGSEAAFAEEMTRKAKDMGAKNSNFVNASGLPQENQYSTARDLALLAERTIRDFPKEYEKYYALKEFEFNKIKQQNRNPLLTKNMGADGVKTGHSDAGGYGIVASAKQGDRRLILVVNGLESNTARNDEVTKLMNWGFTYYKNYKIFGKGDVVDVADVWGGADKTIQLVSGKDIILTLPRTLRKDLTVKVVYDSPIAAPLKAGDKVGTIEVTVPEKGVQTIPLLVAKDIERAGFFQRISNSIHYLMYGKHGS